MNDIDIEALTIALERIGDVMEHMIDLLEEIVRLEKERENEKYT